MVAPFAGAWIEIRIDSSASHFPASSLPSRERGLKYSCSPFFFLRFRSLPSRERGLKLMLFYNILCTLRRSLRGSVDWNSLRWQLPFPSLCRSLRGSVDWNSNAVVFRKVGNSRSLRGSVDWNVSNTITITTIIVAPFAGAWIEIRTVYCPFKAHNSRSLRGSVDWNFVCSVTCFKNYHVAPFAGAWIEILI